MTRNGHDASANGAAKSGIDASLTDNLDVRIEAFVGDSQITIGDLNRVKSGDIVPLSATLADPVELRVNGVAIARGELVAVGDKFAVRIIEIV